jgi:predicted kinase
MPILIILSGLPGVGKTTIAKELARTMPALLIRADTIEHALNQGGVEDIGGLGYMVGYDIATENLKLGQHVVADTVNSWELTRNAWRDAGTRVGAQVLEVEVICSDPDEHRGRVEQRAPDIEGFRPPTWQEVTERDYHPWSRKVLQVDTSQHSPKAAAELILRTGFPHWNGDK